MGGGGDKSVRMRLKRRRERQGTVGRKGGRTAETDRQTERHRRTDRKIDTHA